MNLVKMEPILSILAGSAVILPSLFAVLAAFGHPLTDAQQHAIVALASVIGAFLARSQVTPNQPPAGKP